MSNYIITNILFQVENDNILKLIILMFKRMLFAKYNYKIYNKKLLTIIKIFEKSSFEYVETSIKYFIKILTNY